jgi:hypothetical protein
MKISQLLKFIADLNPQNTPARLALYNFLRHFQFRDDDLTPYVINTFFAHALEYPHWVTNKVPLGRDVQLLLENFCRSSKGDFDFSAIRFPQSLQIIELESFNDVMEVTASFARSTISDADKFRVIPDQGRKVILVTLKADESVEVTVLDRKFVVRNGQLEPLRADMRVTYDANLELMENTLQMLEVAPYLFARFKMLGGKPEGALLRGYVFQRYQMVTGLTLEEQAKIFLPLKRLEQMFIDKNSDPYYLNLIQQLNEAPARLHQGDLPSEKLTRKLLERAELAAREIFIGDKSLTGLIKDLQQQLQPPPPKDPELWVKHRSQDLTR